MLIPTFLIALKNYPQYAKAKSELLSLSERELRDIGLNRGDIERMSWLKFKPAPAGKGKPKRPTRTATTAQGRTPAAA